MKKNRKTDNIVFYLDFENRQTIVLHNNGFNYKKVQIDEFEINSELMQNKSIEQLLECVINAYFAEPLQNSVDCYLIFQDDIINLDYVVLPFFNNHKLRETIKTELQRAYINFTDREINYSIFNKNKKQVEYLCCSIDKNILNECAKVFKKHNLNLKMITFDSNACVNAIIALSRMVKHNNFIFADIRKSKTKLSYINKEKAISFYELDFGYDVLAQQSLRLEESSHSNSQIINRAVESYSLLNDITKSTKTLTMIDSEDENSLYKFTKKYEDEKSAFNRFIFDYQNVKASQFQQEFHIFEQYIELFSTEIEKKFNLPSTDLIVINLPEVFARAFNEININDKIVDVSKVLPNDFLLRDYLNLFGVLYCDMYNKGNNFLSKEKSSIFSSIKLPRITKKQKTNKN